MNVVYGGNDSYTYRTMTMLRNAGKDFLFKHIDNLSEGDRGLLKTYQDKFPVIFDGGRFVGGFEDLSKELGE